jgi:hypothetical protein
LEGDTKKKKGGDCLLYSLLAVVLEQEVADETERHLGELHQAGGAAGQESQGILSVSRWDFKTGQWSLSSK